MRRDYTFILFLFCAISLYSCVTVKYHDYAETNFELAAKYIKQLKDDTIVVAINTYKDKEDILIGAIDYGGKNVEANKVRLLNLQLEREKETENIITAFEENFSFSEVLYMPDSLVHSFERGEEKIFFVNTEGQFDASITYNNRTPIKILQVDDIHWTVVQENTILPNPFPNNYGYKNGLAIFLGLASHEKILQETAKTLQIRFERFYNNPNSRLYY